MPIPWSYKTDPHDEVVAVRSCAGLYSGVRRLVETFYDLIESTPEGNTVNILQIRGHRVVHARIEQFDFLSGFLGGPNLYAEKYGHLNVRLMHEHVEINAEAKVHG